MTEHPDIDDDLLPGDDAPPDAEITPEAEPAKIPPDEGNVAAERKEDVEDA